MHTLRIIWWYPGSRAQEISRRRDQAVRVDNMQYMLRLTDVSGLRVADRNKTSLTS